MLSEPRAGFVPYAMSAPAMALFAAVVIVPLAMTVLLSFHNFSNTEGIQTVFTLKNWRELFSDAYFREMFMRTLRISLWVTFVCAVVGARGLHPQPHVGALEGHLPAGDPGPAADLGGRAHARLGAAVRRETGVINKGLMALGAIRAPIPFMFTETGVVVALVARADAVHGAVGVGRAAAARPADRERGAIARRFAVARCCGASSCRR